MQTFIRVFLQHQYNYAYTLTDLPLTDSPYKPAAFTTKPGT